ncbi:UNVERIFIED_CONTAM: hypothetical protein FKN15_015909 [Acipenser sinensis]
MVAMFGVVTMAERSAAEMACKDPNPIIDGRKANVNLAYLGAKPRSMQTGFTLGVQQIHPALIQRQYGCLDQTPPSYLQTLISPYTPTRPLRSSCTRRLAVPPLRSPVSRARSFSTLAPQWWNDLPTDVRTAQSLTTFRHLLKTNLFRQHL